MIHLETIFFYDNPPQLHHNAYHLSMMKMLHDIIEKECTDRFLEYIKSLYFIIIVTPKKDLCDSNF